jgi:hypothetical protein
MHLLLGARREYSPDKSHLHSVEHTIHRQKPVELTTELSHQQYATRIEEAARWEDCVNDTYVQNDRNSSFGHQ